MVAQIDKGVPLPASRARKGITKYPFRQMVPGDSFFVDGAQNKISAAARIHTSRHGGKFVTRSTVEGGIKGVRVWRVADDAEVG